MGQSRALFVYFRLFNMTKNDKKLRWCAWDSNPGRQDDRRRQIHGAMAIAKGNERRWDECCGTLSATKMTVFYPFFITVENIFNSLSA